MAAEKTARATGRSKLGEILVAGGAITPEQLQKALNEHVRVKQPLGQVLFRLKYVTDDTLRKALSRQLGITFIELDKMTLDPGLAKVIPRSYAKQRLVVPVSRHGTTLTVAMDDPTAKAVVEELQRLTRYSITVVTATNQAIVDAFKQLYDDGAPAHGAHGASAADRQAAAVAAAKGKGKSSTTIITTGDVVAGRADDLFNEILGRALEHNCSDIHLEMLQASFNIRYRIDGVLREPKFGDLQKTLDGAAREVISRIKILAKLDIAERRRPQDGSFRVGVERNKKRVHIDLRVSCVPSYSGESVVIRILDSTRAPKSIGDLDLSPPVLERLNGLLKHTTGILLVTGPTGSGKSTTLYACLSTLQTPEIRILTAEDPVEFVYESLSQSEVNEAIGNTFAAYLRVFLRHDPEVIMVGEIRDTDTAEMAFRAAQTGHLLLSTMHTNSAIAALPRLLDLEIEPSLIASSLIGVLSQRLARRICSACRAAETPSQNFVDLFFSKVPKDFVFYRGAGCAECGNSGYKGRMMVADLWVPDEQDMVLIAKGASFDDVRASAQRTTFSMAQDAHDRLAAGKTTLEELVRVLPQTAISEHKKRFSAQ